MGANIFQLGICLQLKPGLCFAAGGLSGESNVKKPGGSQRDPARFWLGCVASGGESNDSRKRQKLEGREGEPERTNSLA